MCFDEILILEDICIGYLLYTMLKLSEYSESNRGRTHPRRICYRNTLLWVGWREIESPPLASQTNMLTNYTTTRVHLVGFEPTTSCFEDRRSIQLSYKCMALGLGFEPRFQRSKLCVLPIRRLQYGTPSQTRTGRTLCLRQVTLPICPTGY